MILKPAKSASRGAIALLLFITGSFAQDIGHLGVSADPIPLVQAKRPVRRLAARNNLRTPRTNPNSSTMLAEVGNDSGVSSSRPDSAGKKAGGKETSTASNTATIAANTTPSAPPTSKPPAPAFDELVVKADDLAVKGNARAAAEAFNQALKVNPAPPNLLEAQLGLADALYDAKDYQRAEAEYQKIIAQHPGSAEAKRGRADTLYELRRYDEAITEYEAAIKAGANEAGVYNNLGNAFFRTETRENRERAIASYRKAIAAKSDWADPYVGLAHALRRQKQLDEAKQMIEKALQLVPQSALAHSVAGRVYADSNDFARANSEGQKAVGLAPKDSFVQLNLGGILYAQKRYDEAIRAYVAAQSYDRTWAVPRNSLGNLLLAVNRPQEAVGEFETAAQLEPKSPVIHTNLGNAYLLLQKYDGAIANYKIAIELDPKNPAPHSNMGVALLRQGRKGEAVEAFRRAVAIEPSNPVFKTALSDALKLAGRGKEAKELEKGKKGEDGKSTKKDENGKANKKY